MVYWQKCIFVFRVFREKTQSFIFLFWMKILTVVTPSINTFLTNCLICVCWSVKREVTHSNPTSLCHRNKQKLDRSILWSSKKRPVFYFTRLSLKLHIAHTQYIFWPSVLNKRINSAFEINYLIFVWRCNTTKPYCQNWDRQALNKEV